MTYLATAFAIVIFALVLIAASLAIRIGIDNAYCGYVFAGFIKIAIGLITITLCFAAAMWAVDTSPTWLLQ